MTATLIIDERADGCRRGVGPVAWTVLEEAALSASGVGDDGRLWCAVSVRSVAGRLGLGRQSVARAIRLLANTGVLDRSAGSRESGGRFGPAGYWLSPPDGMSVAGVPVDGETVSGETVAGEETVGEASPPADADPVVATPDLTARGRRPAGPVRAVAAGQASLFASDACDEGFGLVAGGGPPLGGRRLVGAVSSDGCQVDSRVHELAPVVRSGADPGIDPTRRTAGGDRGGAVC